MKFGIRVEVPLRNKLYSAIVVRVDQDLELEYKARKLISVIDEKPIISEDQYKFWSWMAHYYCCTIGEVMGVALPAGLKLSSETKVILDPNFNEDYSDFNDHEYLITEALSIQNELTIDQIREIIDRKTVYPFIRSLMDKQVLYVKEELKQKFKPKKAAFIRLKEPYLSDQHALSNSFDLLTRSEKQTKALLAFVKLSRSDREISKKEVTDLAHVDGSVIKAIEKKGIWEVYEKVVSRLGAFDDEEADAHPMSAGQERAMQELRYFLDEQKPVLLHGVTGSGKTRLYIELIQEVLAKGQQVLFLLPEIALTTQIVQRIRNVFGAKVGVYHSRLNNNERVEMWNSVFDEHPIILGARSSLFLPFQNLGLVIVDEEHDPSYKQNDPAPRYNARDAAVWLSHALKAKIVMGSATPSMESYLNAQTEKYGLVRMEERFGEASLPDIHIVDLRRQYRSNAMKKMLSLDLYRAIEEALSKKEQVLIFQNRRGYSPSIQCTVCGWMAECPNCDITLTLHKYFDELKCHYCGHRKRNPKSCPACGNDHLKQIGFGTEKIEEEIQELFPDAQVKRMDYDTVKTKNAFEKIIYEFDSGKIDILVGTQMITKGLDFDNISVVGVLNADMILQFPDLRANERGFQLLTQVAGRAGRKSKKGRVMIQTFQPDHPVLAETISNAYRDFFNRESMERKKFIYPPFFRLIQIELKHKKPHIVEEAAKIFADILKKKIGSRVIGPAAPGVARLRGLYLQNVVIKMEKDAEKVNYVKRLLIDAKSHIKNSKGYKSVRINIDVDPY